MATQKGKVILIGAGPGDPELVTVKETLWLSKADVVLVDRLVSPQIIEDYVSHYAEVIPVGKQCGRGASTPQSYINELLIKHAEKGKLVVRLKGGDVYFQTSLMNYRYWRNMRSSMKLFPELPLQPALLHLLPFL